MEATPVSGPGVTFDSERGEWVIEATPDVIMRLKRIFPRAQQWKVSRLRLKHTNEVADELEWVLKRYPLPVSHAGKLKSSARRHRQNLAKGAELLRCPPLASAFQLAVPLRDYQATATALFLLKKQLLNADWIGLGKTATAIGAFTDPRTIPALTVVQAHLTKQWQEEIKLFAPNLRTHIVKQRARYQVPDADVYIITYSKLDAWAEYFSTRVRCLVFDEIQELRARDSQKYRAAERLREVVEFRYGLSATPISNYGGEMWNIFNILAPDALGSHDEFVRERCEIRNGKEIVTDPDALGHYLRNAQLMVRRTRKEVGRELPPVTRFVQEFDFDDAAFQRTLHKSETPAEELARVIMTGQFLERGQAARQFDMLMRQATGLAKAPFVAEFVRMLLESEQKVILGAWHHAVFDIYRERLRDFNPAMFTGLQSAAQKQAAKEAFINGDSRVLLMSLRSGAGTNGFQRVCSTAVIGELDWTGVVHDQLIGRLARDGQEGPVQVFMPVSSGGSDPVVASVLGIKAGQSSGILNMGIDEDVDEVEVTVDRVKKLAAAFLKSRGATVPDPSEELPLAATA